MASAAESLPPRGVEELALEDASEYPAAVYVSRRDATRDASALPLVARRLYALLDLRELVEEQLRDPARLRKLGATRRRLNDLNRELRQPFGSRKPYEGKNGHEKGLSKQRDIALADLEVLENSETHDRLELVEVWASAYVQTAQALTAYRPYRVEETERYSVYIEQGTDHPKAMVIIRSGFDDALAQHAVQRWCGREDSGEGEE
jgi:hypothetical protein